MFLLYFLSINCFCILTRARRVFGWWIWQIQTGCCHELIAKCNVPSFIDVNSTTGNSGHRTKCIRHETSGYGQCWGKIDNTSRIQRSSLFTIWTFRRQVWWSPCPSRECPDSEELDIVVDQCLDHCLLLEQNPKIEIIAPPTKAPLLGPKEDNGEIDDLNFHLSKRKHKDPSKVHHHNTTTTTTTSKFKPIFNQQKSKYYSPTSLQRQRENPRKMN